MVNLCLKIRIFQHFSVLHLHNSIIQVNQYFRNFDIIKFNDSIINISDLIILKLMFWGTTAEMQSVKTFNLIDQTSQLKMENRI